VTTMRGAHREKKRARTRGRAQQSSGLTGPRGDRPAWLYAYASIRWLPIGLASRWRGPNPCGGWWKRPFDFPILPWSPPSVSPGSETRCPIVCTSLSHRPSAAPPALQAAVLPEQPQPPASSAQQPQPRRLPVPSPPVLAVPGGAGLWPAGGRQGRLAAGVGCLRHALARHAPGGQRGGRAGRPQARAPAGAGWQGVGGRGRVGLREKWLYFSYTLERPLTLFHFPPFWAVGTH
jgi:hypothetical protein